MDFQKYWPKNPETTKNLVDNSGIQQPSEGTYFINVGKLFSAQNSTNPCVFLNKWFYVPTNHVGTRGGN